MNYFKEKAKKHVEYMDNYYSKNTLSSAYNTVTYTGPLKKIDWTAKGQETKNRLLSRNTVDALKYIYNTTCSAKPQKVALLNFADYELPGGCFLEGSTAQEEDLCHHSNLYNILRSFTPSYYRINGENINRGLYTDRALYIPNVVFIEDKDKDFRHREDIIKADVITCAAPNWTEARDLGVSATENTLVFAQRIQFVKDIAEAQNVDILILGAWGCGVFGQNPKMAAQLFNFIFKKSSVKHIVYAIPKSLTSKNFEIFSERIKES